MSEKAKRQFPYLVGLGIEGYVLERHLVYAANQADAYYAGLKFCHPDKGYTSVNMKRLTKAEAAKYGK